MSSCCQCSSKSTRVAGEGQTGEWMRMVFAALVAGQSMIFGLAVSMSPPLGSSRIVIHLALAISAIVVFLLVGPPVLAEAWKAARQRKVVIEQLFLAGIFGAFFASVHCSLTGTGHVYYEVVAILLAIYTFGRILGNQRREAALDAARELGGEFEFCEKIDSSGTSETVPVSNIHSGDIVRVASGGGIPVDGEVMHGTAFVRESALTGEAFPVVKRPGDTVLAGSCTIDQALEIRATVDGGQRVLDHLLETVRAAQDSGSRLQREADRLVAWFLPFVLVVSVTTFAIWTLADSWETGLFNALAVLVVACPCSMGLATPIGIWASLSFLAKRRLIARSSDFVEALGKVDTVVFDKTGTLGEERLELVDFVAAQGVNRSQLLEEVAAIEATSRHPVAMGFRRDGVRPAAEVFTLPGIGIAGISPSGAELDIGNDGILCSPEEGAQLQDSLLGNPEGSHRVWVRRNGILSGLGIMKEKLRETSRQALELLTSQNIRCIVMTGDREEAALAHGFEEVHFGLQPLEKAERVKALQAGGRTVLFVGDGVNDAPAMAVANASISVQGSSALARETAGADFAGEDLRAIPESLFRCQRALLAIRNNLLFAAFYNLIGITLAAAGIIHPVVAALLMLASSLTVSWQALRETREEENASTKPLRPKTRPATPKRITVVRLPNWARWVLSAGIVLQGPAVVYLGGFTGWTSLGFLLVFLAAALLLLTLSSTRPMTPQGGMAFCMFSLGGLFMLAGWWADAGFAAVVRDGVCLCGCADSGMGWGIFLRPNWMAGGMLLASLPTMLFETDNPNIRKLPCWLAGLAGMFLGMELFALLMALVPVNQTAAGLHFFATYAVMVLGMALGMLLSCRWFRSWSRAYERAEK